MNIMRLKILGSLLLGILVITGCQKGANQKEGTETTNQREAQPENQQQPMPGEMPQGNIEVSDAEIQQFVEAAQKVQSISSGMQSEMNQAVEAEGMAPERFNEIQRSQQSQQQGQSNATEKEMQQYQNIMQKLQNVQSGAQEKMQKAIKESGLSMQRYQQIARAAQSDTTLMKKIQSQLQVGMQNQ